MNTRAAGEMLVRQQLEILRSLVKEYGLTIDVKHFGGARGVIVIVTGYGHSNTSSIPGQD